MNSRTAAVQALVGVLGQRRSLAAAMAPALEHLQHAADRGLARELCYGVLRWHPTLEAVLRQLLDRPLKSRDLAIRATLLIGLYQLSHMRVPSHAAVSETVNVVNALGKPWARGLVNGVLRNYLRRQAELQAAVADDEEAATAHPLWLLKAIRRAWPEHWPAIIAANNQHPPMSLRINLRRVGRETYLDKLAEAGISARPARWPDSAVILDHAVGVEDLPGFFDGLVSVQDAAAQLAAPLLDAQPGEKVLDACAAPGGKTGHIIERQPDLARLVALDSDRQRLQGVEENLQRLGLRAELLAADAAETQWWDGQPFDRILLDAPCTGTGVIRRNPDIKVLRRREDVATLAAQQRRLLEALWPLLKKGGMLLYATCSIMPEENEQQIAAFLQRHGDAAAIEIKEEWGHGATFGRQILPGEDNMDGFYYARVAKR